MIRHRRSFVYHKGDWAWYLGALAFAVAVVVVIWLTA